MKLKLEYNAPVVLTFSLLCFIVLSLSQVIPGIKNYFILYNVSLSNVITYFRLVTHVIGHADWNHLLGNLAFILLLGPILEEKYSSWKLLTMILVTAFVTGLLYAAFFSGGLMGASGIVFMMIILSSFSNYRNKTSIPITFILILILYLGREIANIFKDDQISQFAHIIGGLCGGVFGFFFKED